MHVVLLALFLCGICTHQAITTQVAAETSWNGKFPEGFLWSAATASYQVEGGWNADGKGPTIWDDWCHAGHCNHGDSGDVACDSYHLWERDVQMLKQIGLQHYRLSISWARVLPQGTTDLVNKQGVEYYKRLFSMLKDNGISPWVTMFHWDLPSSLQAKGGWLNPDMVEYFGNYSRFCYEQFGPLVKVWLTINEPSSIILPGYLDKNNFPPGSKDPFTDPYLAAHILIRSHARAYHIYDKEFRATQKGKVSIVISGTYYTPATQSPEDIAAADRAMQFYTGWFANPIFGPKGDYPQVMIDMIAAKSKAAGYPKSRLPTFSPEEITYVKGTADFYAMNCYSAAMGKHQEYPAVNSTMYQDSNTATFPDPRAPPTACGWLQVSPWALRYYPNWVKQNYGDIPIYITENGMPDNNGTLYDNYRIDFVEAYLTELGKAITLDKVNVRGYTYWSLMDNLEWLSAYTIKFGLYQVNFTDPNRTRQLKMSGAWYHFIIKNNAIPERWQKDLIMQGYGLNNLL